MRNKLFLLGALALSTISLQATIVPIASDLVNEFNNQTGANVFITANPAWALPPDGSGWVSYANTGAGPGAFSPSSSTVNPMGIFTENFFLPGGVNTGSLRSGLTTQHSSRSMAPRWDLLPISTTVTIAPIAPSVANRTNSPPSVWMD